MDTVLTGVLIYVCLQLIIGWWVSRYIETELDYLLAGRNLGYALGTFTIFATWFGAESVIGSSGAIYEGGLAGGSADPFGFGLCLIFMGAVFAIPLWKRKLTTLADLFKERYSGRVEKLSVFLMIPSTIVWAAAQIRAFGQVLSASSELQLTFAIMIAAGIVIAYTVMGGLLADAISDLIQGITLIIGLIVVVVLIFLTEPNIGSIISNIDPARLSLLQPEGTSLIEQIDIWMIPLCGSVVAHELVARVIATKNPKVARRSSLMAGTMYISIGLIPAFIGLIGIHLVPDIADPEQVMPLLAQQYLPTFFYIIFAGALVSAILSTVDSALLVASALVSHNLILPLKPDMTETQKVLSARTWVVIFGAIAFVIAIYAEGVYNLVVNAAAFGTSGIFMIVVFGLFTGWGDEWAAIATLLAGMSVWLGATFLLELSYAYTVSLAAAFLAYVVTASLRNRGLKPA